MHCVFYYAKSEAITLPFADNNEKVQFRIAKNGGNPTKCVFCRERKRIKQTQDISKIN